MTSLLIFFGFVVFLFSSSSVESDPRFMSISSMVIEFYQFFFTRDLIRNPEIKFCPKSGNLRELRIPNLT